MCQLLCSDKDVSHHMQVCFVLFCFFNDQKVVARGEGALTFFGGYMLCGFPKVWSREQVFLKNEGS